MEKESKFEVEKKRHEAKLKLKANPRRHKNPPKKKRRQIMNNNEAILRKLKNDFVEGCMLPSKEKKDLTYFNDTYPLRLVENKTKSKVIKEATELKVGYNVLMVWENGQVDKLGALISNDSNEIKFKTIDGTAVTLGEKILTLNKEKNKFRIVRDLRSPSKVWTDYIKHNNVDSEIYYALANQLHPKAVKVPKELLLSKSSTATHLKAQIDKANNPNWLNCEQRATVKFNKTHKYDLVEMKLYIKRRIEEKRNRKTSA